MGPTERHAHSVLVVDDYEATRDAFEEILATTGALVIAAGSGHEALDILQDGFRPCVVLLDACMPRMDGWTVWRRMQASTEFAQTPVVMLSAESADQERARRVGIRAFLSKPIENERIVATVERHCERRPPLRSST
jgi:CheY-like chemotaxis protein